MKRIVLFLLGLFLIACQSEEKPQVLPKPVQAGKIIEKPTVEIPAEISVLSVISLEKAEHHYPLTEEVPLPAVNDDLLPEDPFLRFIELKKRYYKENGLEDSPFEHNTVTSIETLDDSYLLGTLRGGVFHYHQDGSLIESIIKPSDSIVNRSVTGIIENSNFYISTYAGIFEYDIIEKVIHNITVDNRDRSVLSLSRQGEKIFWGTSGGILYCLDKGQVQEIFDFNSPIKALESHDNALFLGMNNGKLFSYKDNRASELLDLNMYEQGGVKINDLIILQTGILILTTRGLWLLNNDLELVDRLFAEQVFLDSDVSENYIYMGTHSGGVIIYDKIDGRYSVWGLDKGIPSLNIPAVGIVGEEFLLSIPDKGIVLINEEIHEKL